MARKRTPRPRGAPPANTNALKHGVYSRHISVETERDMETMPPDQNKDELALARARLVGCLEMQKKAPPEDWLGYERAIAHYLNAIASFIHKNAVLGQDRRSAFVTVLEMIRQVNEDQHVT